MQSRRKNSMRSRRRPVETDSSAKKKLERADIVPSDVDKLKKPVQIAKF